MRSIVYGVALVGLLVAMPEGALARRCDNDAAVADARAAAAARCDCDGAQNHGQYVSCVAAVAKERAGAGTLPAECKGDVVRCAARSTCGKPDAVTCCRIDRRGKVKCSTKKSADKCRAPNGGSACVGSTSSCCDACDGACGATSTTTAPPVTTTTVTPTTTTTLVGSPSGSFIDQLR